MRRTVSLALAFLVLLLALWTGYWLYAAGQVRDAVFAWAQARRAEGYTLVWNRLEVDGYPLAFRVVAEQLQLADPRRAPAWQVTAPILQAESAAWDLRSWQGSGPGGATLRIAPSDRRPAALLQARHVEGTLAPAPEETVLDLSFREVAAQAELPLAAARAGVRVVVPKRAPATHKDPFGRATVTLDDVVLPAKVGPLGERVERGAATLLVRGAIPGGRLRDSLARWRDEGGTVELEALELAWGTLAARGAGTLALDAEMQPIAALTARVQGWGAILDALVAEGTMQAGDAVIARLALGLLAKPGPGGRSELSAPVTIQDRTLFIAQVRIARLPYFTWE